MGAGYQHMDERIPWRPLGSLLAGELIPMGLGSKLGLMQVVPAASMLLQAYPQARASLSLRGCGWALGVSCPPKAQLQQLKAFGPSPW